MVASAQKEPSSSTRVTSAHGLARSSADQSFALKQMPLTFVGASGGQGAQTTLDQAVTKINQLDIAGAHSSLAAALASTPSSFTAVSALNLNGAAALDLTDKQLQINYSGSSPTAGSVSSTSSCVAGRPPTVASVGALTT